MLTEWLFVVLMYGNETKGPLHQHHGGPFATQALCEQARTQEMKRPIPAPYVGRIIKGCEEGLKL